MIYKAAVATATPPAHFFSTKSPAITPTPAGTSPTEGRRRYAVVVSSPGLDLQNDRVLRGAVDTANARPVPLLVGHDHSGLPTGMVGQFTYLPSGELGATISLPPAGVSAKADEVDGLIRAGIDLQFSLGFNADEYKPNDAGGVDFSKITVREVSVCPVGASRNTRVLAAVKHAISAKGTGYGNADLDASTGRGDPLRDRDATARCPEGQRCMKYEGRPCGRAESCPLHLGGAGNATGLGGGIGGPAKQRVSIWDKRAVPSMDDQMGHHGSERERGTWAWSHGMLAIRARQRDAEQRRGWDSLKSQLLAIDPWDRPVLRAGIDISRTDLEAMPADVRALVCGHVDVDSDLNGA